jgi:hypothetical protein
MQNVPQSAVWQELDLFFMQQGSVYQTLRNLARNLAAAGIDYAIVGGMALVMHGYVRATQDIDVLLSQDRLDEFRRSLLRRGFVPAFQGATRMFRDTTTNIVVKTLLVGEFPGDGKPKAVSFPNPAVFAVERDGIQVLTLTKLIELKLASGLSAADRLKDLADVQELIRTLKLPEDLTLELDESVRKTYRQFWIAVTNSQQ